MNNLPWLKEETEQLRRKVNILQTESPDSKAAKKANKFLTERELDQSLAEILVRDMENEDFVLTMDKLGRDEPAYTRSKSIVLWMRLFDYDAEETANGGEWMLFRATHAWYWYIQDWFMHHKGVLVLLLAGLVFGAVWLFTGDIFAAFIIFEIIIEILGEFG